MGRFGDGIRFDGTINEMFQLSVSKKVFRVWVELIRDTPIFAGDVEGGVGWIRFLAHGRGRGVVLGEKSAAHGISNKNRVWGVSGRGGMMTKHVEVMKNTVDAAGTRAARAQPSLSSCHGRHLRRRAPPREPRRRLPAGPLEGRLAPALPRRSPGQARSGALRPCRRPRRCRAQTRTDPAGCLARVRPPRRECRGAGGPRCLGVRRVPSAASRLALPISPISPRQGRPATTHCLADPWPGNSIHFAAHSFLFVSFFRRHCTNICNTVVFPKE